MAKPGTKKFTTPIAAYVSDGQNSNEPSAVLARRLKISGSTPSTLETTSLAELSSRDSTARQECEAPPAPTEHLGERAPWRGGP